MNDLIEIIDNFEISKYITDQFLKENTKIVTVYYIHICGVFCIHPLFSMAYFSKFTIHKQPLQVME